MRTMHYFCDHCKKEVDLNKEEKPNIIKLCIGVGSPYTPSYGYSHFDLHKEMELCFDCAKKIGFVVEDKPLNIVSNETIQDRLYEIMSELIQENMSK